MHGHSKRSADEQQSNIIPPWSSAAVTHRSLLNIFYKLTHTHLHGQTHTYAHMPRQSVSHDPSKRGLFVRLLWPEIGKRQKSKCLSLSLPLWTFPYCNCIYEKKGDENSQHDSTKADVETVSLCFRENEEEGEENQSV